MKRLLTTMRSCPPADSVYISKRSVIIFRMLYLGVVPHGLAAPILPSAEGNPLSLRHYRPVLASAANRHNPAM